MSEMDFEQYRILMSRLIHVFDVSDRDKERLHITRMLDPNHE